MDIQQLLVVENIPDDQSALTQRHVASE